MKRSKEIQFLGFIIYSVQMTVTLPLSKMDTIRNECMALLNKQISSIRTVARVFGLLVSSFSVVDFGPLYYINLEKEKINH